MPVIRTDKMTQRELDRLVREHDRLVLDSSFICADLDVTLDKISDEANSMVNILCKDYKLPEGVITVHLKQSDDTMDDTEKMDIILKNSETVDKLKDILHHADVGRIHERKPDFSVVLDAIQTNGNLVNDLAKSLLSKGVV